jgi:hypothetical protein
MFPTDLSLWLLSLAETGQGVDDCNDGREPMGVPVLREGQVGYCLFGRLSYGVVMRTQLRGLTPTTATGFTRPWRRTTSAARTRPPKVMCE